MLPSDANASPLLPLVISVPHGGLRTPPEAEGRTRLTQRDVFEDGDALTDRIYDVRDQVVHCQIATVARAFVDLNRSPQDRAPQNPDGATKSVTAYGEPVWIPGEEPDRSLVETLLTRYHAPYHQELEATCSGSASSSLCGIDCHTMATVAPPTAAEPGSERPLFCLSNAEGVTAPDELVGLLGDAIAESFRVPRTQVLENRPFRGGWIVRRHGRRPLPWIQLEMSRSFYLADEWFDPRTLTVSAQRLAELRLSFREALGAFAARAIDAN